MAETFERTGTEFVVKGVGAFAGDVGKINKALQANNAILLANTKAALQAGIAYDKTSKSFKDASGNFVSGGMVAKSFGANLQLLRQLSDQTGDSLSRVPEKAAGFTTFLTGIVARAGGVTGVLAQLASMAGGLLVRGLQTAANAVLNFGRSLLGAVTGGVRSFLDTLGRIATTALGVAGGGALLGIARQIAEIPKAAFNAAANLQTLTIRLEGLIARQLREVDSGLSVAESLNKASGEAQKYLAWVRKISVVSPFELETVNNAFTLAQSFEFTAREAQGLTSATLDMAAGLGLSDEQIQRIVVNLGQIKLQGKVTGRELRDLATGAFVPTSAILRKMQENLGMTNISLEEFRKLASSGKVDVTEFFRAFKEVSERDFEGAAERASSTFQGILSNIQDFIKGTLGIQVLGPLVEQLTQKLRGFVDILFSPQIAAGALLIGKTLGESFKVVTAGLDQVKSAFREFLGVLGIAAPTGESFARALAFIAVGARNALTAVTNFLKGVATPFAQTFTGVASKARAWGANVITQFAKGMAEAVIAVVNVLTQLGALISSWLAPGSPPKILPKIDKWGAAAFTEYIKGFGQADFSIFHELSDTIGGFLRSLSDNVLPEKKIIPTLLEVRKAIALSITEIRSSGEVTDNALTRITQAARYTTEEFKTYIRTLFEVDLATQKVKASQAELAKAQEAVTAARQTGDLQVAAAQENLNTVQTKYTGILAALNEQLQRRQAIVNEDIRLQEINEALATGLLTNDEKRRLIAEKTDLETKAQIRTVEDQQKVEVAAAQAKVNAATEQREAQVAAAEAQVMALQAEVDAAEAVLAVQQEQFENAKSLIEVQTEQNDLIAQQIALLKSLEEAITEAAGAGGGEGFDLSAFGGPIDPLPTSPFSEGFNIDEIMPNLGQDFDIGSLFEDAQKDIDAFTGSLEEAFVKPFSGLFGENGKLSILVNTWGGVFDKLFNPKGKVSTTWDNLFGTDGSISTVFNQIFGEGSPIRTNLDQIGATISATFETISTTFEPVKTAFTDLDAKVRELTGQGSLGLLVSILGVIGSIVSLVLVAAFVILGGLISGIITGISFALTAVSTAVGFIVTGITQFVQGFKQLLEGDLVPGIINIVTGLLTAIIGAFGASFAFVIGLVSGFITGVIEFFTNLYNELVGQSIVVDLVETIKTLFSNFFGDEGFVSKIVSGFITFMQNLWTGAKDFLVGENGVITGFLSTAKNLVSQYLGPEGEVSKIFSTAIENVETSFSTMKENLVGEQGIVRLLFKKMKEEFAKFFSLDGVALQNVQDFIDAVIAKIQALYNTLVGNSIIPDMMDDINKSVGGGLKITTNLFDKGGQGIGKVAETVFGDAGRDLVTSLTPATQAISNIQNSSVVNNQQKTTNVTVNPSYSGTRTPSLITLDVYTALLAAK